MSGKRRQGEEATLVVLLGDQLTRGQGALTGARKAQDVVLMAEVAEEATYVRHHKKKVAFVFSAMRHFAQALGDDGWCVDYVALDDKGNSGSIACEVERALARHGCTRVAVTEPGEWRLLEDLKSLQERLEVPLALLEDRRFICSKSEFAEWAQGRRQLRMENFYRAMRRKTGLLMEGDEPAGGRWNFDSENRKPPKKGLTAPDPLRFDPDETTEEVLDLVEERFADHFGTLRPFGFAVTRDQADEVFEHFIAECLADFGNYQDAMLRDEPFLYHSVVSPYLNAGLLDPLTLCRRVEKAYEDGAVPLNAAEGFIRQIIGWREYMRGIYWLKMPGYLDENHFEHKNPLPDFYWTAETDMACLKACISQTRDEAYAHHIQRLMVTGNFAMLAGVDPKAVHEWYLAVYADAYEWVELPNTLGMSQFADGGLLSSKPYAASGNYIRRMSDYCRSCTYKAGEKSGKEACPFNYLYWHFLNRQRDKLSKNPRMGLVYKSYDRMDPATKGRITRSAESFLEQLFSNTRS
jgi:deoxyribodipyrimidine photolyase-related protein